MIYIAIACFVILALMYLRSPPYYAAHAARAEWVPFWVGGRRHLLRGAPKDKDGKRLDTKGKLLGYAHGDSLPDVLPNGASFIASYLDDAGRSQLKKGDVVVVDAPARASRIKRRLRIFDSIDADGKVHFRADRRGRPHKVRSPDEVVAKVEWRT
jgi:hypothetical protein